MLCKEIPVAKVAELVGEHDTRLWRMLHHHIDKARRKVDFSKVTRVGMDETSSKLDISTLRCSAIGISIASCLLQKVRVKRL